MSRDLPTQYNPKEVEEKVYRMWEKSGFFAPEAHQPRADNPNSKKTYAIALPPPNITGSLHLGHALNATIQDILIRKKRMEGYKTLWLPGTDHAGIATQNVVEKELKKGGLTRYDLGREKFLEKVWQWKEKYGDIILGQFKKLGCSLDWSRARFTMDKEYQKAVKTAFLHYYKKGWIYRAERVVNWCPRCATSLSDLELEYQEIKGTLYYINYPLANGGGVITVATTRPETMLGDTAVAVNPNDARYKKFIGKEVVLPLKNRKIPVVADKAVDPKFGTGAVKVTPAHDLLDAEIAQRHKLPAIKVIGINGRMTKEAEPICIGLTAGECRKKVVEELRTKNFLEREEQYTHNVSVCYRCSANIEPLPSLQWFLKMDKLSKTAIGAVKSGKVKFHPKRWEKVYLDWLKNVRDWTISRQIWWGHRIPLKGTEDVLDTWFSSALWPFATLGWPKKTKDLKTFYPTQVLSTARDIINLWVSRMIFSGLEFTKKAPFQDVIIHATILTKEGKRMSKSLGTGIDPMDLISRYGADATRFGLVWQAMGGQDIHWSEEHVMAGKKFANKLWNITRFVLLKTNGEITVPSKVSPQSTESKKIVLKLKKVSVSVSTLIDRYEFGPALHELYDFVWHDFADKYIEYSKNKDNPETKQVLCYVLITTLKLLHPLMPLVTEGLWGNLPIKGKKLLIIESWPR
ncbi:MAG: valine--tRNA ligase [Candidatus Sungiibacteriota bacterium]|uniref:valine--tRNA ligase n=1 Tax=Candidatus Sungiibacteriota bacterium TaxID=2750080 RepID=A0A7T5UQE3_9BACT|nr:MAG: valine--tRNA ligase [Candidatus Sungbacteria bacterium]